MIAVLIRHREIVGRTGMDGNLRISMASIGLLDRCDLFHRNHRIFVPKVKAHRACHFWGLIEAFADLGPVEGNGGIDSEPGRTQMGIEPAEAEAQNTDLAVALRARP